MNPVRMKIKHLIPSYQRGGYLWSKDNSIQGNQIIPTRDYNVSIPKETQKDLNKKQLQINRLANNIISKKKTGQFTEEDLSILTQATQIKGLNKLLIDDNIIKADLAQQQQKGIIPTSQEFANNMRATGDKLRFFPSSEGLGRVFDDYVNPLKMVGDLASGYGRIPQDIGQGNYGSAVFNAAMPLVVGATAGLGAKTTGQFVNNLANPLVGTGDIINNLENKYIPNAYKLNPYAFKPNSESFYRQIEVPKNNFQSEIDWAKWNKEIPKNKALMQEYNAIEQQAKADGTWMKNPDGSEFRGTPEQFVQQNSNNFKKAFGNSKLVNPDGSPTIQYHGSAKKFDVFDESKFQLGDAGYSGQGIYTTPSKTTANSYATSSAKFHSGEIKPTIYELYGQANNPISSSQLIKEGKGRDLFNFHRKRNWQGDLTPEQSLMEYDAAIADQLPNVERIRPWNDAREIVFPSNKQLKSAIGNNGMFDMSNPNIYKTLLPVLIATGAVQQQQKNDALMKNLFQYGGGFNNNMNPIQKRIRYAIQKKQYGGTSLFDYFKSLAPKIKGYQGQSNGESNLYSSDAQDYYKNLLDRNSYLNTNTDKDKMFEDLNSPFFDPNYSFDARKAYETNKIQTGNPTKDPVTGNVDPYWYNQQYNHLDPNYNSLPNNAINPNTGQISAEVNQYNNTQNPRYDKDRIRTNQLLETGANIFSLMKGQESYDNKVKESFDTTNTGSFGYRFQYGGNNNTSSYDQILKNIELDAAIKSLPVTKLVSANDRNKKIYDKAGDQLISDINYIFRDKKMRAKADPMLQYLAESGVAKKLEKLDNKDVSYVKDTVNKTGFFNLGNIGKYKDLYKYIKSETGLTSEDAKGILDKAIEKESWVKRAAIKTAIKPFLQYGGKLDQQSNTVFNSLKSKGYLENFDTNSFNRLSKEEQDILFKKAALDFNSKQKTPQGEIIQEIRTPLIAQIDSSNISANQDNFEQQFAKARKEGLVEFEYNGKKIAVKLNPNSKKSIVLSEKPNYKVDNSSIIGYAKDILANKQYGGSFVNKTGYTPGTESYNNPFNIIPGNDITMSQTPFPVLAKPNVGKPVVMIPGRDYKFPGASSVTEIPYKQFGGKAKVASNILKSINPLGVIPFKQMIF